MPRLTKNSKKSDKSKRPIKVEYGSGNVFRDIGFSEEESANLLLRSTLIIAIKETIEAHEWTQAEAAQALGVPQPRISELMSGRISRFTIDKLVKYLAVLGKRLSVTIIDSNVA
jgi:predicted XRE-type DNA-binding protein